MSSFVQAKVVTGAVGTSVSTAYASNTAAGDLLMVFVAANGASGLSISDTGGNTWTLATGSFNAGFRAWYATAKGGATTVTVTWTGSVAGVMGLGEWVPPAGFALDVSHPIDDTPCPGVVVFTPSGAGELACLFAAGISNVTVGITGTGVVQRAIDGTVGALGDRLSTAAGGNAWTDGSTICGCAPGTIWTWAVVFKGTGATSNAIFDAMAF